jgi:hypothetical protein
VLRATDSDATVVGRLRHVKERIPLQMHAWTTYLLHGRVSYLSLRMKSSALCFVGVGNYYDHSGFATEST